MKTATQICKENTRLLGGFDNAQTIAEAIANNDVDSFLSAVGALPKEAYRLINLLCEVPVRNQR